MRSHTASLPLFSVVFVAGVTLAACDREAAEAPPVLDTGGPGTMRVALRVPSDSEIPDGAIGESIRRGRALLNHTRDSLPALVGNELQCASCHPGGGTKANAIPWIGVFGRFPQYRTRSASVQVIEDRITDCFERSMHGRAPARDGKDMRDMVAYFAFLSRGIPVGADVEGQGLPRLQPMEGDSARGAALFVGECARCHGVDGGGTAIAPALWGPKSYNVGAGMARLRTAAAFIHANMPQDRPGTLSPQQAFDLARYINAQPRPDFPGKHLDWPNGDHPPDVAYETDYIRKQRGGR